MTAFEFQVWPTEYRVITQPFGVNPHNYAQFGLPGHEGIDIRARSGSKVFCVAAGIVHELRPNPHGHNYGIHVRVNHAEGYQTTYAHLQEIHVRKGDEVAAGAVLGLADNTGNSYGSHLHLTLKKEGAKIEKYPKGIIDPTPFLLPLLGWKKPVGPYIGGWVMSTTVMQFGDLAQINQDGATLRIGPAYSVLIPGGTIILVAGPSRQGFTPVQVAKAAVGLGEMDLPVTPGPEPPPAVTTVDGWAWHAFLHEFDNQAVVKNRYGINLRQEPDSNAANLGVVRSASTVAILGEQQYGYLPVRVRRADFMGAVKSSNRDRELPIFSLNTLPEDVLMGWMTTQAILLAGEYGRIRQQGARIISKPQNAADYIGQIKGDATVTIAGMAENNFMPVLVHEEMLFNIAPDPPHPQMPGELPGGLPPLMPPAQPIYGTTPGWALSNELMVDDDEGEIGSFGLHLRTEPRRDADLVGFVPAGEKILVMGAPLGEYTPVRVPDPLLQPTVVDPDLDPDPAPIGRARIGLHAAADPVISSSEHETFAEMRPGIIKVLSFHKAEDIRRLATAHPRASWIVRAFLSFGDRKITPMQFFDDTIRDVTRALNQLTDKEVVVELHNEPNIAAEGWGRSWEDGAEFAEWWLSLLERYRKALPGARFIYPGLSPGGQIVGVKQDHIRFVEASRTAVEAADGLGLHLYWSHVFPMEKSLEQLEDMIDRFRARPIWITEASNNKGGTSPVQKAEEYLRFWQALQQRPIVRGVTFFVASASNPAFAHEVWVGRPIAAIIGRR